MKTLCKVRLFSLLYNRLKRVMGIARRREATKKSTMAAMKPTMQVIMACPVEKSRACLTATIMAARAQIQSKPPRRGMKVKIARRLGELAKPMVRRSSP